MEKCLSDLQNGKCDLAFLSNAVAGSILIRKSYTDISSLPGQALVAGIRLQFTGENAELLVSIMDKGIRMFGGNTVNDITAKYALDNVPESDLSVLIRNHPEIVFAISLLIVIIFSIFILVMGKHHRDFVRLQNTVNETVQNIPAGLAVYDAEDRSRPLYVSDQVCALFGFTRDAYNRHLREDSSLSLLTTAEKDVPSVRRGGVTYYAPFPASRRDGSRFWLRITAKAAMTGEQSRVYAILSDVTDSHEEGERLDAIIHALLGGVVKYTVGGDYRMSYVSDTLYTLLGMTKQQFIRKFENRFDLLVCPEDREQTLARIREQVEKDVSYCERSYRIEGADGEKVRFTATGHLIREIDGSKSMYVLLMSCDRNDTAPPASEEAPLI